MICKEAAVADHLRVRNPGACALLHPESGLHVVPRPDDRFSKDDPLVRAYPWAFGTDEEIADEREEAEARDSVPIEQATKAPGEKRPTRRAPRK